MCTSSASGPSPPSPASPKISRSSRPTGSSSTKRSRSVGAAPSCWSASAIAGNRAGAIAPKARSKGERRQVLGVMEIAEIPGDRQLECAPLIGCGIAFAQTAGAQRLPLPLDFGRLHAACELVLELFPVGGRDRARGNEGQPFHALRMFEEVQYREQSTPRVTAHGELLEPALRPQGVKVGDVLPPSDRRVPWDARLPAAALVVIQERSSRGQEIVLWKEIVVTRTRPAVQHDNKRAASDLPCEEPHYSRTARASATSFTSACSRSPNPFGRSESISIWPRIWSPRRISTTRSDLVNTLQAREFPI